MVDDNRKQRGLGWVTKTVRHLVFSKQHLGILAPGTGYRASARSHESWASIPNSRSSPIAFSKAKPTPFRRAGRL